MEYLKNQIKRLEKEIGDLRSLLATVSESEGKYRHFFEKDSDAIVMFDERSLVIEDVNISAVQLFGYAKELFKGLKFEKICALKEQTLSEIIQSINRYKNEIRVLQAYFATSDGSRFPGTFYSGSFETSSGTKLFVAIRDISEKLKIEEQLMKSREQLFQAQKMEALGTLVAGVAHEINNPINLIMYNTPLLKRIWDDFKPVFEANEQKYPNVKYGGLTHPFINENMGQLISDMDMAAKRVETIVRRLKDFSRKSNILEKSEISVNDAVKNALRLVQSTLKKSNVMLQVVFSENIPLLKGHMQSIEQVILNLLINAIEAITHNHGKIRINTSYLESEKTIIVQVQDNGKGMPPQTREKIFDPFFTQKQADGGTGLGLSVSYSLIKSHDGEITCQSEPDKGALFEIRLPLEPQKKQIAVLIADDDRALRKLISQMLKRAGGFLIEMASNGTEALIKLGTFLPDVLILDLFMPQMNGLEVCQAIIKEKKLAKMKVIIITGMPNSPEIAEIKKIGYMNIYTKPLDVKTFARDISGMFQKDGF